VAVEISDSTCLSSGIVTSYHRYKIRSRIVTPLLDAGAAPHHVQCVLVGVAVENYRQMDDGDE
jgi:hypothetical protein